MQLHVLGPAFGLPSIDAECIATVALLRLRAPEGWSIIPTHEQTQRLPCLIDDRQRFEGFKSISAHLAAKYHVDTTTLDRNTRATSTAITTFIESHAQTLLDISLYVSFDNYSTTRTAFTKILPWHANYMIPPKRRAAARTRTEHLGISSIDVDDVHEDLSNRPAGFDVGKERSFEAETQKKASLLLGRKNTVTNLLRKNPEHSAVFKLHALADNFFGSLEDMLGDGWYLLGTSEPEAVDCFAYGHLSLMLYPKLPQDWLATTLRKKYAKVVQYIERMHQQLDIHTNAEAVMSLAACGNEQERIGLREVHSMTLPWQAPATSRPFDIAATISRDLVSQIPLLKPQLDIIPATSGKKTSLWRRYFPAILASVAVSLGLASYGVFAFGLLAWPHGEEVQIFGRRRLADYGHLGAALAGISLMGQQAVAAGGGVGLQEHHSEVPPRVEVEVEADRVP